ncbi:MAG TPA: methyltransferase domain-containing protein [Solirubrobacteraceae bacterium]|jgi:SAM-dependent methyltransferase|nr:methyltransferase domain-containing protein [Solirubrobacteraceae bacterium]
MAAPLYERIGRGYTWTRRADPRIQRFVEGALGGAESIVNVGAGAGAYEPVGTDVIAVEPSAEMRAQRPAGAAPCLPAAAERLPLADDSVDMAMAIYTDFHWHDRRRGIAEMLRVSRRGLVILTVDGDVAARFWLTRDYLPSGRDLFAPLGALTSLLPTAPVVTPVPVPHDCVDGFVHAFWRRPEELLDPDVHGSMAMFARAPEAERTAGLAHLAADITGGAWARRNPELAGRESLDLGHRLVVWRPVQ